MLSQATRCRCTPLNTTDRTRHLGGHPSKYYQMWLDFGDQMGTGMSNVARRRYNAHISIYNLNDKISLSATGNCVRP
jgi:hypothetical protein